MGAFWIDKNINERYERASIMLTSNRAASEWPDLFGDPLLASAGLDRLADNAHTLVITGSSFRAQRRELRMEEQGMGADPNE
jgi:DNA replication protein DnaC